MEERDIIFKVGTKVKLRDYLKVGSYYGGVRFEDFCKQDFGKVLTITKVTPCNGYISTTKYEFEETPLEYTVEMLEPIKEKTMKYKVGDKVIFKDTEGICTELSAGVFTIRNIATNATSCTYIQLEEERAHNTLFRGDRFIKVPLFKVGQVVQFHNIKEDKWYSAACMDNLEGKYGIVTKVTKNRYVADKQGQDGCTYEVKDFQDGEEWYVTSASLKLVPTIGKLEDVTSVTQDKRLTTDIGITTTTAEAIAQAVDNVKGPQFKIGDRVLIREDLVPGKKYEEWDYSPEDGMGGWEFAAAMAKYMGKVATITGYVADDPNYCHLDIDKGTYSWIVNSLLPYTPGSDYDLDKTNINVNQQKQNKQNENQLQGKEEPLIGGCECTGTGVCYPGEQAATGIRHLGYRKITYKC